ncbi:hypothetical protein [Veronia pacifica]|uniref:hypothetical protein n=1 Tax=Veronia pacifica TaxID=1080227 RepID=UPI00158615AB|nr:hypothetical protein [Veronia pacifica]
MRPVHHDRGYLFWFIEKVLLTWYRSSKHISFYSAGISQYQVSLTESHIARFVNTLNNAALLSFHGQIAMA